MIRINLLPIKQLQAEVTRRREIIIASAVLALTVLVLVGAHMYQHYQLTGLEKELSDLRTELQVLNTRVKEVSDLQVKIKDLRGKQKIIDDLSNKKSGPVLVMTSLSQVTPASLWLTELRESGGVMQMNGLATDNETVASFLRSLTASKYFSDIALVETVQDPAAKLKKFSAAARVIYRPPPSAEAPRVEAPNKAEEKKG